MAAQFFMNDGWSVRRLRILHCCLSEHYIDNFNYQENILPAINKLDGHEVKIIASTENYDEKGKLIYVNPGRYFTKDNIEVNRIPYRKYFPHIIMKKIRHYSNLYYYIEEFSPDVIMCHGMCTYDLITIAEYKKNNPDVKFYTDSHEDKYNSGVNWISRNVLHKLFYKKIIKKAYKFIDKIFYITYEAKMFLQENYDIECDDMEYLPLGGNILDKAERNAIRDEIREQLNLQKDDILIVHSGRLDDKLKLTRSILEAFVQVPNCKLYLLLIGSMNENTIQELNPLILSDKRIKFLGWKKGNELIKYLCACDLYVQPGTQSCTMQTALCCGSAAALFPYESHKYLLHDNVFYIETVEDMRKLFESICENHKILEDKRLEGIRAANEMLDYKLLASRLYK